MTVTESFVWVTIADGEFNTSLVSSLAAAFVSTLAIVSVVCSGVGWVAGILFCVVPLPMFLVWSYDNRGPPTNPPPNCWLDPIDWTSTYSNTPSCSVSKSLSKV